ncbi:MAG: hypothetical protein KGQ79_11275 [Proteobacteria bacterium]|nr:hypothetical protein [Pseudomonadota bacterium]MBU6425625.1 hypothetical protein [Rhodospirillales bacterium]
MKKLAFALPLLALASCGGPPPQTFKPLDYSYLPPILLKVSNVNVVNSYVPTPSQTQVAGMDPAPPADTLMTMLYQRLKPAGQPGTATVTVQTAYVDNVAGNLTGALTVDLNLASADGRSTGFTEASVSASHTAPDSGNPDDMRAALYALTKQLMTQMNVQLQYQIQKNLPSWVSWTSAGLGSTASPAAGSAAGGMIQAAPLTAPPGVAAAPMGTSGATTAPAPAAPTPPRGTVGVPTYLPGAGPAALGSAP